MKLVKFEDEEGIALYINPDQVCELREGVVNEKGEAVTWVYTTSLQDDLAVVEHIDNVAKRLCE